MRIIDSKIGKEILSGDNHPQIKIGDKLYTVDDRKSTYDKIQKVQKDEKLTDEEIERKTFVLALGEEATNEIYGYDLPVENFTYLTYCVLGAVTGQEPDDIQRQVKNQLGKN